MNSHAFSLLLLPSYHLCLVVRLYHLQNYTLSPNIPCCFCSIVMHFSLCIVHKNYTPHTALGTEAIQLSLENQVLNVRFPLLLLSLLRMMLLSHCSFILLKLVLFVVFLETTISI